MNLVLLLTLAVAGGQVATCGGGFNGVLPSLHRPANHSHIFYAVMFDAGSTGTRIHIYTFIRKESEALPVLDNEMFHWVKPGLSAHADSPVTAAHSLRELLKVAKSTVPRPEWKRTPVVLRATAGLRLLPAPKAQSLLDQVRRVFDESPFLVPDNSVSIMNGTSEGILAWISVNFLSGHLHAGTKQTVGILDLGGGSTQITFLPHVKADVEKADEVGRLNIFNSSFVLYTRSYLGNGLMAARLSTLGALGARGPPQTVFKSPCLPKEFQDRWSFGGETYHVSGDPVGASGFDVCYQDVLKTVKGIIHQPQQLRDTTHLFYAFSYYFDRALDAGLIDEVQGGTLEVSDFTRRAEEVCKKSSRETRIRPFLCLDLTYISSLLKDGFGFKESTRLLLAKKVNNVEASWALGAMLDHLNFLQTAPPHPHRWRPLSSW
ncbi:ectonucleoside triphosphate diphosphohydrolase 5 isoform X2 [Dunckerocampus dactyliophorus]|nr:ectonucleoside triphosphate diphosphohydrolase 5 isoform X2 [Dunckerocampus dactyliophorus]XP_054617911.1 ectonucleoside triphosphate diphosphohydrolase 5 isoform X2 [Dunckerocampus dactyliophorus]XP_054617912.1 ectonucleoside triphosphate diphosphohydrolase 5 isoform X2 [Dunckerocampus dactyliophorus]